MNSLQDILKIKEHENPPQGYMSQFVAEFHRKQRAIEINKAKARFSFSNVKEWVTDMGATRWIYATGAAYACVVCWLIVAPSSDSPDAVQGSAMQVSYPNSVNQPIQPSFSIPDHSSDKLQGEVSPNVIPSDGKPF